MSRWPAVLVLLVCVGGPVALRALHPGRTPVQAAEPEPAAKPLTLPPWWRAEDPLPVEKTNCVRCHLTAGRELTTPLRDFARSVHDLAGLSCHDCHGGNTHRDATAHEPEHGFIGTKLSAHMQACAECHTKEAGDFRKGPHYWDLSKSINRGYPVCVDCHGNHDVGKPPADFALVNVCTDCHKQFAATMPATAAVVEENDRLWETLRKVHAKNSKAADPTPDAFRREVNAVRHRTARLLHDARPIPPDQAEALNRRSRALREGLETWLRAQK